MSNKKNGDDYYYKVFEENTDNSYFGKYGSDVILTGGAVLFIVLLYLFFEYRKKISYFNHALDKDGNSVWSKEKCKPYILPISGMIKREPGMNSYESTYHNFKKCSEEGYKTGAWKFFNPLYLISGAISVLLSTILSIVTTIKGAIQTITHYIVERFKHDKRRIDAIEQEVTYTISQQIYKRIYDSVKSLKEFFLETLGEGTGNAKGFMGLWQTAQKHIGILLRQYHLDLFNSIAQDLKSQSYFQRIKAVIISWIAITSTIVAAGLFTGPGILYALLAAAVISAIYAITVAVMQETYIEMRQKVIDDKEKVVLMYDLMRPGLKNSLGEYDGPMPAIPPSFIAAARTERDFTFLYGPLDFSKEVASPETMMKWVKDAQSHLNENKNKYGAGAGEALDVTKAKKIRPTTIGPAPAGATRTSGGNMLETDQMAIDRRAAEGGVGDANSSATYSGNGGPFTEGGNIGSIENIEPLPYYYLTQGIRNGDGDLISQILRNVLDIKRNDLQIQYEKASDEDKGDIKNQINELSQVLDSPNYRGQWGNTHTHNERDLFAGQFYKKYGRNTIIITLKDYEERWDGDGKGRDNSHTNSDYYGGYQGGDSRPYGKPWRDDKCETGKQWYMRIVNGLKKMNNIGFKNNAIIPIGKNNANKYQIILFNVKWTSNVDYGTYNPTDTSKIFRGGKGDQDILTEEDNGRGKLARKRLIKNHGENGKFMENIDVDNNATENRGAGGIHKLFGRSYNSEKLYGPWSSGNWVANSSTNDYFEIYLFKPDTIRLYKETAAKEMYGAGLITFELVKVRITGNGDEKRVAGYGRSVHPKHAINRNHDKIHGTKGALDSWLKKEKWGPKNSKTPNFTYEHINKEIDFKDERPYAITINELEKRDDYGRIAYFGDCDGTGDEKFDCNYSSKDSEDWKDVGMKTENFSREHVDIAIKSIYESNYNKNKIFNGTGDINIHLADWEYNDTIDSNVSKYLEDKSAGKSLRLVTATELNDTKNGTVPSGEEMVHKNAPYFISTYDKSKLKLKSSLKARDKARKDAREHIDTKLKEDRNDAILILNFKETFSNEEGFSQEVIENGAFKDNENNNFSFFNFRNILNFDKNKEGFSETDNERIDKKLEKIEKNWASIKTDEQKAAFRQYNEATLNLMIKQYEYRRDYEVSEDFGVINKYATNGSINSGYDRQNWTMNIKRVNTTLDNEYERQEQAASIAGTKLPDDSHGKNQFKFGFVNPVFFDGDQRASGACFGKNTKIQLKSGKKINIQNLKLGDVLFDNSIVTATSKHLYQKHNIYKISEIIITDNHGIIYDNNVIPAYLYPNAKLQNDYKYKYLYCFSTDTKRFKINDIEFCDWDEVSDSEINYLASIGKINPKIQHSFIHQQFDSGFIPSTMIELNNGNKVKIEDLHIGDKLKNMITVLAIIRVDVENIKLFKHYIFNKVFYGTNNMVYAVKNNYCKNKLKHVSTYFQHEEKYKQEWSPNKNINCLYHVITDNKYIFINGIPFADYNESLEVFLPSS